MADRRAAAGGALPGMAVADARAVMPDLLVHPADPAADAAAMTMLADWCGRYTPWTALTDATDDADTVATSDGIWLDITGCAHLAGGETALAADLLFHVKHFGFDAQVGIADTPGAAWAAARFLATEEAPAILPPNEQRARLARLPVAALRIGSAVAAELDRLGLRRIDDLYPLPRAALARRFGAVVGQRLDQALGRVDEPISPRRPVSHHVVRMAFPEPVVDAAAIVAALSRLVPALCRGLDAEGVGARRLTLGLYRVDGTLREITIGTARPSREPEPLQRLFLPQLETIDAGFGIEVVTLAASMTEPLSALQMVLHAPPRSPSPTQAATTDKAQSVSGSPSALSGSPEPSGSSEPFVKPSGMSTQPGVRASQPGVLATDTAPTLDRLLDTVGNRLGFDTLRRLAPRDSHAPERAQLRVAPDAPAAMPSWWRDRPRPLRLAEPSPVPVTEGHDGEPVAVRARQSVRALVAIEGPERIEPEWWRPAAEGDRPARDYWRVEDEDGGRFWLYRERAGGSGGEGRWFLHGLFA